MQQVGPNVKAVQSIEAQDQGISTVNGAAVDTADFNEAMIVLDCGTAGGEANVKVQESVDAAFTSPVDIGSAVFTEVDSTNDDAIYVGVVQLDANRMQYLRVVSVVTTGACALSASIILAKARTKPAQSLSFNL